MRAFMATWLFVMLFMQLIYVIRAADKKRQSDASYAVGAVFVTAFFAVPTIFVFGWILLPAYGIGVH